MMTLMEFKQRLAQFNYKYGYDKQQKFHLIRDSNNDIVAMISETEPDVFMVFQSLSTTFLNNCIIHFARTPLEARVDLDYFKVYLSASEYNCLKTLSNNIDLNQTNFKVSTNQMHALRHLQKQINLYYHPVPETLEGMAILPPEAGYPEA